MKFFLPCFLFLLPFSLLAQKTTESNRRLAFVASPDLSYFAGYDPDILGKQFPRLGYRFRIDGELRLSKRSWLRSGVGFARMNYKSRINKDGLIFGNQLSNPGQPGESVPDYIRREDKMIIVPAALRYFWNKQLYSDFELGANLILIRGSDEMVIRPNFGCAFGWQKAIGSRAYLFVQPAFRFIPNLAFTGSLSRYNQHPYSFGIETGVRGFLK